MPEQSSQMRKDNLRSARTMGEVFAADSLVWFPEHGLGYYPVKTGTAPYNDDYFERYRKMANTFVGRQLMHARVDFVGRHIGNGRMVDIGIGSGAFIQARNRAACDTLATTGYDVKSADWDRSGRNGGFIRSNPARPDIPGLMNGRRARWRDRSDQPTLTRILRSPPREIPRMRAPKPSAARNAIRAGCAA